MSKKYTSIFISKLLFAVALINYCNSWAQNTTELGSDKSNLRISNRTITSPQASPLEHLGKEVDMAYRVIETANSSHHSSSKIVKTVDCSCLDSLANSFTVATEIVECFYGPYMVSTSIYWPFANTSCEDTNGNGQYTFTWNFGDGVQEVTDNNLVNHIFPATASYMVNVTVTQNSNGCSRNFGSTIYAVKGNPCSGSLSTNSGSDHLTDIQKPIENNQVLLYPNPVQQLLTVTGSTIKKGIHINVCDINGRKIFEAISEAEGKFELDVSNFPVGVYSLNIMEHNTIIQSKKLIKD
ncbi:T9SS type A sorting domain-containing protein [Flavobacterium sp. SUN046]|uniref:T9SS type A sorting domain-containing protein n=1 Tax=Flavobacterium sp. SUN046 TaxID=3002440 RepID=UPI002DBBCC33|nr:T9SS type A sorting domain-containing protein [Flavobacterium sp. SUN046]MEC4050052.1 T9SS type A sorting domain-containing protein [Flavobacterium sp. SUN046]